MHLAAGGGFAHDNPQGSPRNNGKKISGWGGLAASLA
jgi:hypothetical protein